MWPRLFFKTLLGIALAAFVIIAHKVSVNAEAATIQPPALQIAPAIQELELAAGANQTVTFNLQNSAAAPYAYKATLVAYEVDENNLPAYKLDKLPEFAEWIKLTQSEILLEPLTSRAFTLDIVLPEAVPAGSYISAVIFSPVIPEGYFLPQSAKFFPSAAAILALNISRPDINGKSLESSLKKITIDLPQLSFSNNTDYNIQLLSDSPFYMRLQPSAKFSDVWGNTFIQNSAAASTVLSDQSFNHKGSLPANLPLGRYVAQIEVKDTISNLSYVYHQVIWVLPWQSLLMILISLALIFALVSLFYFKRENLRAAFGTLFIKSR